jgi:hypothetical protein
MSPRRQGVAVLTGLRGRRPRHSHFLADRVATVTWHAPCQTPGMSQMSPQPIANGQVVLRVFEGNEVLGRLARSLSAGARGRRGSGGELTRRGHLRLAPRLTVLTGGRRGPAWARIAGGMGAALAGDPVDETPLECA